MDKDRLDVVDLVAVVGDVVVPAAAPDPQALERSLAAALTDVLAEVSALLPPLEPLTATTAGSATGFRGAYPGLGDAALAALLVRLAVLDAGGDLRVGLGRGASAACEGSDGGAGEGTAWEAARRGAQVAERLARSPRTRTARTWWVDRATGGPGAGSADGDPAASAPNAFFAVRDDVLADMTPRARRLLAGLLRGVPQAQAAASEGISQPAVSQGIASSGAAAVSRGHELLGAPRLRRTEAPTPAPAGPQPAR